jgi:hypothetical protein
VTELDPSEAMRQAARDALREMMPELLKDALAPQHPETAAISNGHAAGNGSVGNPTNPAADQDIVPVVPAPPVAAVLRPSTWNSPPAPGEVIGDEGASPAVAPRPSGGATAHTGAHTGAQTGAPAGAHTDARAEAVTIDTDEELDAFVRSLAARLENPRDRLAVRAGKLRFTLRRPAQAAGSGAGGEAVRVEKGAVTERAVRDAAARSARLVLARRAVLTPLARDQARALGVHIEREG